MDFLRPEIAALEQNGITRVALTRIGDPNVIPLWFGEGDSVTDEFIREAAKEALDAGDTFYTHTRGKQALRDALKRCEHVRFHHVTVDGVMKAHDQPSWIIMTKSRTRRASVACHPYRSYVDDSPSWHHD